jgi:hypothetical protein
MTDSVSDDRSTALVATLTIDISVPLCLDPRIAYRFLRV